VLDELEANGVHVVTNARTESLHTGPDGRVAQVVTNRGSFASGCVILSLGVRPNVALVKKTGIRLGKTGGILTDERQQTSVDHIYAAGDCCEVRNAVSGRPMYLPLATLASRAGWVAGENAAGGHARFTGAIRAIAVKVFGIEVAQVGLSADEARDVGFQVFTERITAPSRVALMPGAGGVALLLIVDKRTGRLLGANAWGVEGSVQRANALGIAIQHKMTVDDIARFDMIYAPPFAPLWDPVLVAANQARKKLAKLQ
jgi:pyruvate/2-oxoglutarate dehydrogenase complex dihydrolipoamide dehydrogenase (E3) component